MTTKIINRDDLHTLICAVLINHNTSADNASCVADALIAAEIDGQKGHGLLRLPPYAKQTASGKIKGHISPQITAQKNTGIRIDAGYGFAFPAFNLAIDHLIPLAKQNGIAAASIYHSHHFGQAGYHVERLANRGLVALLFGNSPKAIAPWGGIKATFGTNPIAFAAPRQHDLPLVIDLSLSQVARGKILLAQQQNENIPLGWALDKNGKPTTDPSNAINGTMLPIGEAKGAALVMMVEILSAALTGAQFAFEASSFFDDKGKPPGVGQFLLAIDGSFFSNGNFTARLEYLINIMLKQEGVRLPGCSRLEKREIAHQQGISIDANLYKQLRKLQ